MAVKRDPLVHKRFLDYREAHGYFGRLDRCLEYGEFAAADQEHRELDVKIERDDEEEARLAELTKQLYRD